MKFLVTWQLHEGKLHDTLAMFARMGEKGEQANMPAGVKLLGRWHDLVRGGGVAIVESPSAEAISAYALGWNRFMDLDIAPVVDDEEARDLGNKLKNQ